MCLAAAGAIMQAVSVGVSANAAYYETKSANAAYEWNARMLARNRDLALEQAKDAEQRGLEDASSYRQEVLKTMGQANAAAAASGVGPGGSVADIQATTAASGEIGAQRLKRNAAREAWAARVEASNYQTQASLELAKRRSPGMAFASTLIGAGGPALGALGDAFQPSKRGSTANTANTVQAPSAGGWTNVKRKAW